MLTTKTATDSDIAFLARIIYEASLPPHNHSFWDEMLQQSNISALDFLTAVLQVKASNWGNVEDFLIVERAGEPVAAAAGYEPSFEDYRPLKLEKLDELAQALDWSIQEMEAFQQHYLQLFGNHPQPIFFNPQAPWIIESVAVVPEARGQGVGKTLLKSLLKLGREQGRSHVGITVINGNDRARKAYESLGFKPYQTFHGDYFREQFGVEFSGVTKLGQCLSLEVA